MSSIHCRPVAGWVDFDMIGYFLYVFFLFAVARKGMRAAVHQFVCDVQRLWHSGKAAPCRARAYSIKSVSRL
ncbi:hypothetical protein [Ensifer sp. 1H6]|uniref:hypothetical protein n=1 Tax=Ensifer sp. 1H6 TaxID=1911585 RepID=UPI0018E98094|nr:hypothetical protein [Ensifer sp. 1H6]